MSKVIISTKSKWLRLEPNTWHNFEADLSTLKTVEVKPAKFDGQTRLFCNVDFGDGKGWNELEIPWFSCEAFDEAIGDVYRDAEEDEEPTVEMRFKRTPIEEEKDGKQVVINKIAFQDITER